MIFILFSEGKMMMRMCSILCRPCSYCYSFLPRMRCHIAHLIFKPIKLGYTFGKFASCLKIFSTLFKQDIFQILNAVQFCVFRRTDSLYIIIFLVFLKTAQSDIRMFPNSHRRIVTCSFVSVTGKEEGLLLSVCSIFNLILHIILYLLFNIF